MSLSKEAWLPRSDLERVAANDPSLTEVDWYDKGIGDGEVIQLAEALRDNTHVTTLSLWYNKITDAGAKALAEVLRVNGTVTHLSLSNNWISDAGAKALAEVLRVNSTVTTLYLNRNYLISDDLKQKVNQLVEINRKATTPEDAHRRKEEKFGRPPRQAAAEATASLPSKEAKSEVGEATTEAKPPAQSQDVAATSSGRDSSSGSGGRAHGHSEQEQRDRELAERLQREEEERASPTTRAAAADRGAAAAVGTEVMRAAATGAVSPHAPPMHAHGQSLTREEQAAVAHLTKNIADIDRSLESVRGLPKSLAGAAPEVQRYFLTFCAAFERAYIAALALASGAVKVQLSGMKDQMLGMVLKAVGNVASDSNIPALGVVSIVASIIVHQRETRQVNLFTVFHDFFRGHSRDQYLITCRRLAEQICRRFDFAKYASDVEGQKRDKKRVGSLLQAIKKHLESAHFLQPDNVQPIDNKATADLAEVTEVVLTLRKDAPTRFESLKAGPEKVRIQFLLKQLKLSSIVPRHYACTPANQAFQRPIPTATPHAQQKESSEPGKRSVPAKRTEPPKRSEPAKDVAWFQDVDREIARLRQEHKQHKAVERRLCELEEKVGSERDVTASGGGSQVQAQLLRSRNAQSGHRGAAQTSAELDSFRREVYRELRDIRVALAAQSEQVAANSEEVFISKRILRRSEVFQLIETVLTLARVEVSTSGTFVLNGRSYQIGFVPSHRIWGRKNLWNGRTKFKIEQVYKGTEPVSCWFEQNNLEYIYDKYIKKAIRQMFHKELHLDLPSTSARGAIAHMATEQDRVELFDNS